MRLTDFGEYCYFAKVVLIEFNGTLAHYQIKGYTKNPDHKTRAQVLFNEFSTLNYAGIKYIDVCGEMFTPQELAN